MCVCVYDAVLKMNATEMERTQLMTETWKGAAQEVIDMLIAARDPDKLKPGTASPLLDQFVA